MRTANCQPILWRLYTDAIFRKEFIFDKEEFYSKYDVSSDIVNFLDTISIHEILFCAEDLLKRRMLKVKTLLPLTFRLFGEDITAIFLKFCNLYSLKGIHRHHEDADQFIQYLLKQKIFSSSQHPHLYIRSVMLYESKRLFEEGNKPIYALNDHLDRIFHRAPVLRKEQRKRTGQRFRVIGNNMEWMSDRRKKEKKRKKRTTPFLLQKHFL